MFARALKSVWCVHGGVCVKICFRDEGWRRFSSFFFFPPFLPPSLPPFLPSFLEYKGTIIFSSLKDASKHSITIYSSRITPAESSCYNQSFQEVMGAGGRGASHPLKQIWRKAGPLQVTLKLGLELIFCKFILQRFVWLYFLSCSAMKRTYNDAGVIRTSLQIPLRFWFVCLFETENSVIKSHLTRLLRESKGIAWVRHSAWHIERTRNLSALSLYKTLKLYFVKLLPALGKI